MSHRIRLGPIAVFLAIVAIVLSVMAVLTTATAHADKVMADRFADVTAQRYEIEAEGERLLADFDAQAAQGTIDAASLGLTKTADGYSTRIKRDGYTLTIVLSEPDASGSYEIDEWKITKEWNADDPVQNIWKGD